MTLEEFLGRYSYWMTTILMVIGIWGMLGKRNLMKKLIGMNIFQSAVILFFVTGATKFEATVPIRSAALGTENPDLYANPLPHTLMLTAIVVSVATTGVALAVLQAVHRRYESLDEPEIIKKMEEGQ
ncbi:MAG: cation:proton antiporter subunit C [Thermoleophilia bacterium]